MQALREAGIAGSTLQTAPSIGIGGTLYNAPSLGGTLQGALGRAPSLGMGAASSLARAPTAAGAVAGDCLEGVMGAGGMAMSTAMKMLRAGRSGQGEQRLGAGRVFAQTRKAANRCLMLSQHRAPSNS